MFYLWTDDECDNLSTSNQLYNDSPTGGSSGAHKPGESQVGVY